MMHHSKINLVLVCFYHFYDEGAQYNECVGESWDPEGGENAVIIQPGIPQASVVELTTGPTLEAEYSVNMTFSQVPKFVPEDELCEWEEDKIDEYEEALEGNQIGGTPLFVQGNEFPEGDDWQLLLQLDSTSVPFEINFGDAGVGYAFINKTGNKGKFLFQCL